MTRMTLTPEGATAVIVTRRFAAPPAAVFRAHTDPAILPLWLTGPDGWTMPVCISEPWPGGRLRCEWTDGGTGGFYLTGEYLEVEAPLRILHVERMHMPDPTADNRVETRFAAVDGGTLLTLRMTLPDAASCAGMMASGMEEGMEASYARLDAGLSGGTIPA